MSIPEDRSALPTRWAWRAGGITSSASPSRGISRRALGAGAQPGLRSPIGGRHCGNQRDRVIGSAPSCLADPADNSQVLPFEPRRLSFRTIGMATGCCGDEERRFTIGDPPQLRRHTRRSSLAGGAY